MNKEKQDKLSEAGWKVGDAEEFLGMAFEVWYRNYYGVDVPDTKDYAGVTAIEGERAAFLAGRKQVLEEVREAIAKMPITQKKDAFGKPVNCIIKSYITKALDKLEAGVFVSLVFSMVYDFWKEFGE
jgi:hypothetical protein